MGFKIQRGVWIFSIIASAAMSYGCDYNSDCPKWYDSSDEEYCCSSSYCCDYSDWLALYDIDDIFGDFNNDINGIDDINNEDDVNNTFQLGIGALYGIVCAVIALPIFVCVGIACCCSSRRTRGTVVRDQTVGMVQTGMVNTTFTQQPQPGQQYPAQTAYPVAQPAYAGAQTSYPAAQPGYSGAQPAYPSSPPAYPVGQAPYQAPQQPNPMDNKNAPMPELFGLPPSYSS